MSSLEQLNKPSPEFAERRRRYFVRMIRELDRISLRDPSHERDRKDVEDTGIIGLQEHLGLWTKQFIEPEEDEEGNIILFRLDQKIIERKHQAPEHMSVEAARVQVLAMRLGLSEDMQRKITLAAAIHDAFKARERAMTDEKGTYYDVFRKVDEAEEAALREAGVNEELIELQNAAGHPFNRAWEIIQKYQREGRLSEFEIAWLLLYVTDMGTMGMSPAVYNSIDKRTKIDQPKYPDFDESARGKFEAYPAMSGFEAMRFTGHAAEKILAELLSNKLNRKIDPAELMLLADTEIQKRALAIPLTPLYPKQEDD